MLFGEIGQFGGADEREVERIEVEANPLALEVRQADVLELSVSTILSTVVGLDGETRGLFADLRSHGVTF